MAKMSSAKTQLIHAAWGSIAGSTDVPPVMAELLEEAYEAAYAMPNSLGPPLPQSSHSIFVESVKKLATQYSQQTYGHYTNGSGYSYPQPSSLSGPYLYTKQGEKYCQPGISDGGFIPSRPTGRSWQDTDQQLREACPGLYAIRTPCPYGDGCGFGRAWRVTPQPINQVVMHLNDQHHWPRTATDSVEQYVRIPNHRGIRFEPFDLFPNVADWLDYMAAKEGWDLSFKTPEEVQADKEARKAAESERTSKNQAKALMSLGVDQQSLYVQAMNQSWNWKDVNKYMYPEWEPSHYTTGGGIDWDKLTGYYEDDPVTPVKVNLSSESLADGTWLKGWPTDKHPLPSKVVDHGHGVYEFKYDEGE